MTNIITREEIVSQPDVLADDERGIIERLGEGPWQSILRITSKAGTVRANHYHKHDSHLCFLAKGKVRYVERPVNDEKAPLEETIVEAGQLFYTRPMVVHAMHFLEDSEFYTLTPRSGDQSDYENDIERVELVSPASAKASADKARRNK